MYQVGLMEADQHVQFFWNALESFSQVRVCMRVYVCIHTLTSAMIFVVKIVLFLCITS